MQYMTKSVLRKYFQLNDLGLTLLKGVKVGVTTPIPGIIDNTVYDGVLMNLFSIITRK